MVPTILFNKDVLSIGLTFLVYVVKNMYLCILLPDWV